MKIDDWDNADTELNEQECKGSRYNAFYCNHGIHGPTLKFISSKCQEFPMSTNIMFPT